MFLRSPQNANTPLNIGPQTVSGIQSEDMTISQNLISQRWFSEEALSIVELNEEFLPSNEILNLRLRSESESNLDDWEKMDVQEIDGKPSVKATKVKNKKTKVNKNANISPNGDKPIRRTTRAAAVKARAKCKEETNDLKEEF